MSERLFTVNQLEKLMEDNGFMETIIGEVAIELNSEIIYTGHKIDVYGNLIPMSSIELLPN
jgi:hypothetical protein